MRLTRTLAAAAVFAVAIPVSATAQNSQLSGFGGLTFGDVTNSSTFGGAIAVPLSDNFQIVGEGGRMTNLVPSLVGTIVDFTPLDFGVSAWYGEAGVRVIGSPRNAVRPYVEATAGMARLTTGFDGAGDADPFINSALGFFGTTEPLFGAGGGVMLQGGPVFLDLGYRYKKIMTGSSLQSLLTGGDVSVNQVRLGVGVRF